MAFKRINLDDPATVKRLVLNGAIWKLSADFWQYGIDAINKGLVNRADLDESLIPPQVKAAIK